MRLNICVFRTEKLAGTLTCNLLDLVNILAAAVVALSGVALGVLVCQNAASRSKNALRNDVLRSNKLDVVALS